MENQPLNPGEKGPSLFRTKHVDWEDGSNEH